MSETGHVIAGGNQPILIIADHASAHVPVDMELGISPALLHQHIAIDIGVAEVSKLLATGLRCTAILGGVSRLVIDLNREEDAAGLVPIISDGHDIPGNHDANRDARLHRFHRPYHERITALLDGMTSPFILSVHSFTPQLATQPDERRPWDIGILYNQDDRAARIAIPLLQAAGLMVGDQLPYSGVLLNATMNRHAEARAIPYLGIEMRQDLVSDAAGQHRFAEILLPIVAQCRNALA